MTLVPAAAARNTSTAVAADHSKYAIFRLHFINTSVNFTENHLSFCLVRRTKLANFCLIYKTKTIHVLIFKFNFINYLKRILCKSGNDPNMALNETFVKQLFGLTASAA